MASRLKYFYGFSALSFACCFSCFTFEDNTWLSQVTNRVDEDAIQWLRDKLKDDLPERPERQLNEFPLFSNPGKCNTTSVPDLNDPKLLVFMSFSLPESVWLSLSQDISSANGVFVIRGLPENSFQVLAKRLLALKEKGLSTPVHIHPQLFEKYAISAVPSFVLIGDNGFDKLVGNISLRYVLDAIGDHGDATLRAKQLKEKLYGS